MYNRLDLADAGRLTVSILDRDDLWTKQKIDGRSWIHTRFNRSWKRQLYHMDLLDAEDDSDIEEDNPYDVDNTQIWR
jgi:hypothetical protein